MLGAYPALPAAAFMAAPQIIYDLSVDNERLELQVQFSPVSILLAGPAAAEHAHQDA